MVRASEEMWVVGNHSVKYSFSEVLIQLNSRLHANGMVFLRAYHAGATVFHMPLSTHGISFNIDL